MDKAWKHRIILPAILLVLGSTAFNVSLAAPPPNAAANSARNFVEQRNSTPPRGTSATPLDLRIPAHPVEPEQTTLAFPSSALHRHFGGVEDTAHAPGSGAEAARERPPLEDLARRIHREGLPVARLWENKSALVHIGLNQRGKPGLWLVQKIH